MCTKLKRLEQKSAIVYKIVARKLRGTRYYSVAMGFRYPKKAGKIPRIEVQNRLGSYFNSDILHIGSCGYKVKMVGKTAGFLRQEDAESLAKGIRHDIYSGYRVIVVKSKLTDGLMSGEYGPGPVIAGKHIEFLE